ncbi:MAG: hypothetical protein Q7J15_07510 [Candidatus Desulfaltia sp.]|nr:hypothetical protein [Candidatus Desulfaltia sp.]
MRIEKAMPFQALIKDYKSDRIYRIFRIFFAFPEERQKFSLTMAKVGSQVPFSRLWAGLYFLSLVWRLRKIKNPKNPVNPVDKH